MKLLVANRGEIAIRIIRAAAELNIPTVSVYPEDDASSLHTAKADETALIEGVGTAAYLNIEQIISAAQATSCDAVHPGYGFLAENAEFAKRCGDAHLTWVGPHVEMLELFGDKARAREAASKSNVPIIRGLDHAVALDEATTFFQELGEGSSMMIKAIGGGGGRGSRVVTSLSDLETTYERCRTEALAAFGNGDVYVEEFIQRARHIEIQIMADRHGNVAHLGERECSVQRNFQKIIEVAPAPMLESGLRNHMIEAAVMLATDVGYTSAGTFEFLVDISGKSNSQPFAFIEANARLQVEHTVTEEVTGIDIVKSQLKIAEGATLSEIGLGDPSVAEANGFAIQARVCMESANEDGTFHPTSGTLTAYEAPSGPGIRTDGFGYSGYETSLLFDSLLAKVIGHSRTSDYGDAITRISRALSEFRIEGVDTNISFLQAILNQEAFANSTIHTRFIDEEISQLLGISQTTNPQFIKPVSANDEGFAGAQVSDAADPLALFSHDANVKSQETVDEENSDANPQIIEAIAQGQVLTIGVDLGEEVTVGQPLLTIESLELHHVMRSTTAGIVHAIPVATGETVDIGTPLMVIEPRDHISASVRAEQSTPSKERNDLLELTHRRSFLSDSFRSEKIAKRHAKSQRSPRENFEHLLDGTFREYGPLVTAASWQKQQWLRETTQADGLMMGIGQVNGDLFNEDDSRAIAVHYDYMVVAGTQGGRGHYKQDRIYVLAKRFQLPVILFAEGGGGRPGVSGGEPETSRDLAEITGLRDAAGTNTKLASSVEIAGRGGGGVPIDSYTFTMLPELSGLVPLVGVNSGRCFAGNTVLLACCDVIIAAENSTIGLGGPAMIEGGGLGIYTPEEVGPMSFQVPNGVVDILVKDDYEAVETAKKYISYFQGAVSHWETPEQKNLRDIVPEDRHVMYDMYEVINTIADIDSILEIRKQFGIGIITAFIRVEGKPLGLIANNPEHLSGAIDSDASDKAARFLQLCDTFDVPVLSLMDCPGIAIGPEQERQSLLRKCGRLFVTGANMTTPILGVVVRKAYGLGVQAMCGGSSMVPFFTVAWPTAEFAPATIDASVRLTFQDELDSIEDLEERQRVYDRLVQELIDQARAVNSGGTNYGIDDVIDPIETRDWIAQALRSVPAKPKRTKKKRPNVDTW